MEEGYAAMERNASVLGLVALSLRLFASRIIGHGLRKRLDDADIAAIRSHCALDLKNADFSGLPIEEEAEVLRQAVEQFEQLIDSAIAEGREAKDT